MKEHSKQVILAQIEKSISALKKEITELESARQELLSSENELVKKNKTKKKRLPAGAPKKMALSAIKKHRRLFVSDWVDRIEEEFGKRLNDSTIRRAIAELESDGVVEKLPDGSFTLQETPPIPPPDVSDDDLPF